MGMRSIAGRESVDLVVALHHLEVDTEVLKT
jgi:hypothetical protein